MATEPMLIETLRNALAGLDDHGLRRRRRTAHSPCGPRVDVQAPSLSGSGPVAPRPMLAFCSNDYLGLAAHPHLIEALAEGARRWGAGSGASHLISGHHQAHQALEDALADFLAPQLGGAPVAALSFCTGYMANLAVLTALGGSDALLLCEALNHASLIDGARLSRAAVQVIPHRDVAALEAALAQAQQPIKLIVTDSVFSMDGSLAPLADMLALAERHDAWLVVDDAHGFGVLGPQGRGSLAHLGLSSPRCIYMGTLGKAAGLAGAFVVAHEVVIDWMVNRARPYIYTTAAPPALAHALRASLDLIMSDEGDARRRHLHALIERFRGRLRLSRWQLLPSFTPIQPLVVGDNAAALQVAAELDSLGFWVPAIRPPTVPVGTARLRISLTAAHTLAQVDALADALSTLDAQEACAASP
jgi:8-amino-7-oxononanoate synthase